MTEANLTQMISVAAKWWADKLRRPSSQGDNMGAEGEQKFWIDVMSTPLQDYTDEQVNLFESTLKDLLLNGDTLNPPIKDIISKGTYFANIGTDYHPGPYLTEACQIAFKRSGFGLLPFKSIMFFSPTQLMVRNGYRDDEILFKVETSETVEEPAC